MYRVVAVVLALFAAAPCRAAAVPEDLLTLVPSDPGICLIVRDVSGHMDRLWGSPFADKLRNSPNTKLALAEAGKKYEELDKQLQGYLQTSIREIRDGIFGDGFVFAFWPGKNPADERGLFLVQARKPELLSTLVKRLNELESKSGNMAAVETRQYGGMDYWRRVEKKGDINFVLVRNGLVAVSQDEATLKRVIDLLGNRPSASPVWQQVGELGIADALAVLWLNPRVFDPGMQEKVKSAPASEAAFHQVLLGIWKEITTVAFALRLDADLEFSVHIRGQAGWTAGKYGTALGSVAGLWQRFPENSVLAVAGLVDFSGIAEAISMAMPSDAKVKAQVLMGAVGQAMSVQDFVHDVLPNLGPNWGFFVAAPPPDRKGWFPDFVIALQVRGKAGERPLEQAIFDAVRTAGGLIVFTHAQDGMELKTEQQEKVKVISIANTKQFPPGCQPAFAVKAGCLIAASSPAAVRRFGDGEIRTEKPSGNSMAFQARFSFGQAVAYLRDKERRSSLVATLGQAHQQSPAEVDQQIEHLLSVLEFFRQAEMQVQNSADRVVLSMRLAFAEPLRK